MLSSYAISLCPYATSLCASYAMSGTRAVAGTATTCGVLSEGRVPPACYALSGTELAYDATGNAVLSSRMVLPGVTEVHRIVKVAPPTVLPYCATELAYGATRLLCTVRYWASAELAYAATPACYALSGTELAYGATHCAVLRERMLLRTCYAVSGTERAYGATGGDTRLHAYWHCHRYP
eukprot:194702-Rhodomonas_salina.1